MPVECNVEIRATEQERFHAVDRVVTRNAFEVHNTLGRFCDERVYQETLAERCRADGLDVHREVMLRVSYQSFSKPYYLDMLIERSAVYELKAVETLNRSHQEQLINYLLLADVSHGKLMNFRSGSVESRFVSTRLRRQDRMTFQLVDDAWQDNGEASRRLRDTLFTLLAEWGTFLEMCLYREALVHFMDAPGAGVRPVNIEVAGRVVGAQSMCLLSPRTAWHLSAVRQHQESYETHLVRLLRHTHLERIHWINLDQRIVTFRTLTQ